jgi:predicted Zn-dependent protease with MMP-like domain
MRRASDIHLPHMSEMIDSTRDTPDGAAIERLARKAVRQLPQMFRNYLTDVVIRVEEFADSETLRAVGLNDPWELTGLYQGRPLSEQSIWSTGDLPSIISLFRRPLLNEWRETGVALEDLVTHVIVHEVGHHFGLSDDQMHAIENNRI